MDNKNGRHLNSVAMLHAMIGERRLFQVIASDRSARSIEIAKQGCYSVEAVSSVPFSLRKRFFRPAGSRMTIVDELRERIQFV